MATQQQISTDAEAMARVMTLLEKTLEDGSRQLNIVDGERAALPAAYTTDGGASASLQSAILSWEEQLKAVMSTLGQFHSQLGGARNIYTGANAASAERASQLASQIGAQGLTGL